MRRPFGSHLRLSVTGASHAPEMTFRLENFPAGFRLDADALRAFMERRAPGRDRYSTQRRETDAVVFRAGFDGCVTTGAPIVGAIANRDMRPGDYGAERTIPRPGHADFGQWIELGRIPTGGGANSGRLTAPVCAAGGLCRQFLAERGITVTATLAEVGGVTGEKAMLAAIDRARKDGDSVGGRVRCRIENFPAGVGGALFDGLESELAAALYAIPGVKGVTFGDGDVLRFRGSAFNDAFRMSDGAVVTATNRSGGILGGRATGGPIAFDVFLRPTPTVFKAQASVDLATKTDASCEMKGRHDPCIARRAVPVVEAVAALTLADALLADEAAHPRICLTLTGRTLAEDVEQYRSQRYFTDMVELRVDLLTAAERARAAEFPSLLHQASRPGPIVPIVFTFRRKADGGAYEGGERTRERFFRQLLSVLTSTSTYVDFEEDFRVPSLEKLARARGVRIVRSLHDFAGPVKNLASRLTKLSDAGDIAKVAFQPKNLADVSRLFTSRFSLLTSHSSLLTSHLVLAMGPQGLASRVLAGRLGAPWTYASVGGLDGLGHVTPQELVRDYRFRSVTPTAALYGVTGWPLKATRSPELHNAMFAAAERDALMIPFPAKTAREAIAFMEATGMRGLAVTIPHKESVMPLLARVDAVARRVGAVNTVVREGGRLVGYNTDVAGFTEAIAAFVGRSDFTGLRVAVLGAGGASKAVVFALGRLGAFVEVFHRRPLTDGFDLIVNATPVDPIADYRFTGRELVYDLVYVPAETPLLKRARAAGCRGENGFSMLVAQAREQQRLWKCT